MLTVFFFAETVRCFDLGRFKQLMFHKCKQSHDDIGISVFDPFPQFSDTSYSLIQKFAESSMHIADAHAGKYFQSFMTDLKTTAIQEL